MLTKVLLWESTAGADTGVSYAGGIDLGQGHALFGGGDPFGRVRAAGATLHDVPPPDRPCPPGVFCREEALQPGDVHVHDLVSAPPRPLEPLDASCDTVLQPPPFSDVSSVTRGCFASTYGPLDDWPHRTPGGQWLACPATCVNQDDTCPLPTDADRDAVWSTVWVIPLGEAQLAAMGVSHLDGIDVIGADELAYTLSAISLLLNNQDLIEWACCMVQGWSPEPENPLFGTSLCDCLDRALNQDRMSVYLIADFQDASVTATGFATNLFPGGVGPDGRRGPVVNIRDAFWQQRIDAWLTADDGEALFELLNLATVLLHEMVHMCAIDSNPDCTPRELPAGEQCCWEEQRMIGSLFDWAMAQRYPCLQTALNCHAANPCLFANSAWEGGQFHSWGPGPWTPC